MVKVYVKLAVPLLDGSRITPNEAPKKGNAMDSTLRRTWARIDLDALAFNYQRIKEHIGPDAGFLGVVKADAYGHGSVQTSLLLQELGARYLAVSSLDEAVELRNHNVELPILILGHTPMDQTENLIKYNITQSISCHKKAFNYSQEAQRLGKTLKVHIKIDTGMSRMGYLVEEGTFGTGVNGIVEACRLPGLEAEGVFTHFALADEPGEDALAYTNKQLQLFLRTIEAVEAAWGKKFQLRHCANTGATAVHPHTHLDMVRPGLLLYGYGEFARMLGLRPVMSLRSAVQTIKVYPEGTKVSYGGTYTTSKVTRIGVLPYGYADGFLRSLSNKAKVKTVDGIAPQIGRICMDMCMIDITNMPNVCAGSEVEIFGSAIPVEEMAEAAGTIPYELTCSVSKRVPRLYYKNGEVVYKELLLRS